MLEVASATSLQDLKTQVMFHVEQITLLLGKRTTSGTLRDERQNPPGPQTATSAVAAAIPADMSSLRARQHRNKPRPQWAFLKSASATYVASSMRSSRYRPASL
jgi:hypothetical protein